MARLKVTISTAPAGEAGYIVRWTRGRSTRPAGIVAVRSRRQAEELQDGLEHGLAAASAIHMALMPRRKKIVRDPGKVARLGGFARAERMTPEERSASARAAANAKNAQRRALAALQATSADPDLAATAAADLEALEASHQPRLVTARDLAAAVSDLRPDARAAGIEITADWCAAQMRDLGIGRYEEVTKDALDTIADRVDTLAAAEEVKR